MKSPLKKRTQEALKQIRESEEVQRLRKELASIHQQIQKLVRPVEKADEEVPANVRTDFLAYSDDRYISWELTSLQDDGRVLHNHRKVLLIGNSCGDVRMHIGHTHGFGMYMGADMSAALEKARSQLQGRGWVFVGADVDGDRVRITDWRELA